MFIYYFSVGQDKIHFRFPDDRIFGETKMRFQAAHIAGRIQVKGVAKQHDGWFSQIIRNNGVAVDLLGRRSQTEDE